MRLIISLNLGALPKTRYQITPPLASSGVFLDKFGFYLMYNSGMKEWRETLELETYCVYEKKPIFHQLFSDFWPKDFSVSNDLEVKIIREVIERYIQKAKHNSLVCGHCGSNCSNWQLANTTVDQFIEIFFKDKILPPER